MFKLEQAISDWRRQMLAAGIKAPVPLEELESHLRDEIEQLAKSGLTEVEAFQAAVQKIGPAQAVQNEFKKVRILKEDRHRKWTHRLLIGFSTVFPLIVGSQVFIFKTGNTSDLTAGQKTSCLAALVLFALFAWGGQLGHRMFPVIPAKRKRDVIIGSCGGVMMLWWMVLLNFIFPRCEFTVSQLIVTLLWGFITPAGVMIGVSAGIEMAARRPDRITTA